jgi:hypothetical protein
METPMKNPFKDPRLAKMFDVCLTVASDNFDEFYYSMPIVSGEIGPGPRWPRRGAAHRHAFWNGYSGSPPCTVAGSLARAAYRAGQEFRRQRAK